MSTLSLPTGASLANSPLGCPVLTLAAKGGTTSIALVGANILSFIPDSGVSAGRDLLWVSSKATTADGKPIRGGVPLCGPWFGPHASLSSAPAHGLMRIRTWSLTQVTTLANGALRADLSLDLPADKAVGWNHKATALFSVTVGATLSLELSVRNTGTSPFLLTGAMHTYFSTSDVRKARVEGLADREFIDFTGGSQRRRQGPGAVTLTQESAYFYLSNAPVRLVDEGWNRAIALRSWGSGATVVWNPWEKTASTLADVGAEWTGFICVENANIPDLAVTLPPSMTHHMGVEISPVAI